MKYTNPDIDSFYRQFNHGKLFYDMVIKHKPKKIVELGPFAGYTTVSMAMALHELGRGKIRSYDLWDKYPYKHSTLDVAKENARKYGLKDYIDFREGDLYSWLKKPEAFDMLYVDISNNGDIIELVYKALLPEIKKGKIIFFEGGSKERDNVEWMHKYNKRPFADSGVPYIMLEERFPSFGQIVIPVKPQTKTKGKSKIKGKAKIKAKKPSKK